jgi:hypothetical protein
VIGVAGAGVWGVVEEGAGVVGVCLVGVGVGVWEVVEGREEAPREDELFPPLPILYYLLI